MGKKRGELGNAIRNARLRKQAELQTGQSASPPPGGEAQGAAPVTPESTHTAHGRQHGGHAERGRSHSHRDKPHH